MCIILFIVKYVQSVSRLSGSKFGCDNRSIGLSVCGRRVVMPSGGNCAERVVLVGIWRVWWRGQLCVLVINSCLGFK